MKQFIAVLVVAAVIIGAIWLDYSIWHLQHPGAPGWTFLLR